MRKKQRSYLRLGAGIGMLVGLAAGMAQPVLAADLVEIGRKLFSEETFEGNGRTCATCHPATNNFTIDPAFIRRLPRRDPLFVAEFNSELKELEDSGLLRRFGLILENLDGFDQPGVMRAVPHNLALRTNTRSNLPGRVHALGWSGDGGAGDGSIRMFAVGAITQHFPKSLNRVEGVDFRLPTAPELDAIEAFMLSLGRQEEIDLAALTFTEDVVQAGKLLFNGQGVNRSCSACHANAGANRLLDGVNANFDQGTGRLRPRGAPPDGGFGQDPEAGIDGLGDGTMNTPSLIEAADTAPYFHNNAARTLEDAIRFYTTDTFGDSPAGRFGGLGAFELSRKQILAIGALLRTLNAMENIRFGNTISAQAQHAVLKSDADQRISEAIAETSDAIEVLARGPVRLYRGAVRSLRLAARLEQQALREQSPSRRSSLLQQAIALKSDASAAMIN